MEQGTPVSNVSLQAPSSYFCLWPELLLMRIYGLHILVVVCFMVRGLYFGEGLYFSRGLHFGGGLHFRGGLSFCLKNYIFSHFSPKNYAYPWTVITIFTPHRLLKPTFLTLFAYILPFVLSFLSLSHFLHFVFSPPPRVVLSYAEICAGFLHWIMRFHKL